MNVEMMADSYEPSFLPLLHNPNAMTHDLLCVRVCVCV